MNEVNPNLQKHLLAHLQAVARGLHQGESRIRKTRSYLPDETVRELLLFMMRHAAIKPWMMDLMRDRIFSASTREDGDHALSMEDVEHLISLVMGWNAWPPEKRDGDWMFNDRRDWHEFFMQVASGDLPMPRAHRAGLSGLYLHTNPTRREERNFRWALSLVNTAEIHNCVKTREDEKDWRYRIDPHHSTQEVLMVHVRGAEDCMKFIETLFVQFGTKAFPQDLQPPYLDRLMSTAT